MPRTLFCAVLCLLASSALATVPTATNQVTYTCNGTTVAYTVTFKFLATGDLVVTKTHTSTGIVSTLLLTTDYTVTGAGGTTGTVTLTAGSKCASGYTLTIKRTVTYTQGTAFSTQGSFNPKTHENAFDRLTMEAQQLDRDRAELAAKEAADVIALQTTDAANLATTLNAVAALNTGSHAVGDTTSILAYGTSTARTLTARFADVYNVKDFGAIADGVTTGQEVHFQAAFDAVPATGGTVVVPCGDYVFSGAALPKSNTTVQGQGPCSILHMQDAAWNIHTLPGDRNIGMLVLFDVHDVRVTGLSFVGSTTMDCSAEGGWTYCPQLLMMASYSTIARNIQVDSNTFGPTAGTAFWSSTAIAVGLSNGNQNVRVENNHFHDIGYNGPTDDPGVGVQTNYNGAVISGNVLERVGIGIAGTGSNLVISGNFIRDFTAQGIVTGDYGVCRNISITGNTLTATVTGTEHALLNTYGIIAETNAYSGEGYTDLLENGFSVVGNVIHFIIESNSFVSLTGLGVTNADGQVSNNSISYDFRTNYVYSGSNTIRGIKYFANERDPAITTSFNHVEFYTNNSSIYDSAGITGIGTQVSVPRVLTLVSNHNRVSGLSTLGKALEYAGTTTGVLKLYCNGDFVTGGTTLLGTYISVPNRPIYTTYDSTAGTYEGDLFLGGIEVGHQIKGSTSYSAGVLNFYGQTTAGSGNAPFVFDTSESLLSNDPEIVVKNHGVYKYWISNTGKVSYLDVCDLTGTPGPGTCDKPAGKASIAAAASSVVITSDQVTASSGVLVEIQANDTTCTSKKSVIPASGSFTVTMNAACNANTKFFWVVHN